MFGWAGKKRHEPFMHCRQCGKQIIWDESRQKWVHVLAANETHTADPK